MSLNDTEHYLIFTLDDHKYALHRDAVERCVRAVAITPLPKAPPIVLGLINVAGRIIPVLNIRERFRLPWREIQLADELIIARAARRTVALVVDAVGGLSARPTRARVPAGQVLPGLEYVEGVVRLEDGDIVLIHDLDRFLSIEEAQALDDAVEHAG